MSKQHLFFLLFHCFPFTLIAQQENPDPTGTWELTHFGSPSTATLDDPADLEIIPPGNTIPPKDFKPVPILWKFDGKDRLMVRQLKTYFKGLNYRIDGNTITVDHNIHYDIHQLTPESMVLTSRRGRSITVDTFYFKKTSEEPGIFDSIATSMAIRQLGPLRFDGVYLSTTKGNNEKIQLLFRFYPDSTFIMVPVRGQVGNEPVHYTRFNRRDIEEFQFPFNQVLHLNLIEDRAITKFIDEYPVVMEFSFEEDQLTVVLKEFDPSEDKPIGSLELTQTFFPVGGLPYYFDTSQNDKAGQEAFEEEIGETSEAAKDKPEIKPENMPLLVFTSVTPKDGSRHRSPGWRESYFGRWWNISFTGFFSIPGEQ